MQLLNRNCTPFLYACKEFFEKIFGFFETKQHRSEKKTKNSQKQADFCLKQPEHRSAEQQEIEYGAQSDPQKAVETKQALSRVKTKKKQGKTEDESEQKIADKSQPQKSASPCPQIVIEKTQGKSKQRRERKRDGLRRNRQLHQPNRRAKKPPTGVSSS